MNRSFKLPNLSIFATADPFLLLDNTLLKNTLLNPPTDPDLDFSFSNMYTEPDASLVNAVALAIVGCLTTAMAYLPARSFLMRRNVPALSIVVSTVLANVFYTINAIIWHSDKQKFWWKGYGLCDVEVALRYPLTTAFAASLCALSRGLANALNASKGIHQPTKSQRLHKIYLDAAFCWTIPVLQIGLQYIVQTGRYNISPVFGCSSDLDNSWPTILIVLAWTPLFMLGNLIYAVLLLFKLWKHHSTIGITLMKSGSGFRIRPYVTMVLLTFSLILIYVPVQIFVTIQIFPTKMVNYSWHRVHNHTSSTPEFYHTGEAKNLQYRGWTTSATLFFLWCFYGFDEYAMEFYRWLLVKLGFARFFSKLKFTKQQREALRRATGAQPSNSFSRIYEKFNIVNFCMRIFGIDAQDGASLLSGNGGHGVYRRHSSSWIDYEMNRFAPRSTDRLQPIPPSPPVTPPPVRLAGSAYDRARQYSPPPHKWFVEPPRRTVAPPCATLNTAAFYEIDPAYARHIPEPDFERDRRTASLGSILPGVGFQGLGTTFKILDARKLTRAREAEAEAARQSEAGHSGPGAPTNDPDVTPAENFKASVRAHKEQEKREKREQAAAAAAMAQKKVEKLEKKEEAAAEKREKKQQAYQAEIRQAEEFIENAGNAMHTMGF